MLNTQRLSLLAWDNLGVGIIMLITTRDKHYYDEDDIEVGKPNSCKVVVNHTIELTEEEKAEARQRAVEQYQREELSKIKSRNAKQRKENGSNGFERSTHLCRHLCQVQ